MNFNNFNCNIGNQIVGTLNINKSSNGRIELIQQQLDKMVLQLKQENFNTASNHEKLCFAIDALRKEISSEAPKRDVVDQSLKIIDGVSSFAAMASQIRSLLSGFF